MYSKINAYGMIDSKTHVRTDDYKTLIVYLVCGFEAWFLFYDVDGTQTFNNGNKFNGMTVHINNVPISTTKNKKFGVCGYDKCDEKKYI